MPRCPVAVMAWPVMLALAGAPAGALHGAPAGGEGAAVEFNRDIRPILADKCYACHGPDEKHRKAGLRLDVREGWSVKLEDGVPIVPGDPGASTILARAVHADRDQRMPPPKTGKSLSEAEVAMLKRWIERGAPWQGHWAWEAPQRRPVPELQRGGAGDWSSQDIDRFILARLTAEGLKPAPEASRRELARRLSVDLLGLPATPELVEGFASDARPDAYARLVDTLLASPHFGERMAMFWLDLVRYADSIGYHSDNPREVWLYRDYVIQSFNDNLPYDRFTREQIAGDLLPGAGRRERIASGYNRLLQTTEEGGAQPKEYAAKYDADRVRNLGSVWLGVTLGCAECHDHKYDPFTMRDFYRLASFFADIDEAPVGGRQHQTAPGPQDEARLAEAQQRLDEARKALETPDPQQAQRQLDWETQTRARVAAAARSDLVWITDGQMPKGKLEGDWTLTPLDPGPALDKARSRRQASDGLVQHFVLDVKDKLPLRKDDAFFAYVYLDPKQPPRQVMLQFNAGGWEHRGYWGEDLIPYGGVGQDTPAHRRIGDLPPTGQWVRLEVPAQRVGLDDKSKLNGMAFTQWGGVAHWNRAGVARDGVGLSEPLLAALAKPADQRTPQQLKALAEHFRAIDPSLEAQRAQLAKLQAQVEDVRKSFPRTLWTTTLAKPRTVRILPRGDWLNETGPEVTPDTPAALPPLGVEGRRPNRLDLADWLLRGDHPLTARVFVNHLWKQFFGQGLARTPEDFGSQSQWPTHPELLDHLALEFRAGGWDVKRMIRTIVLSRTYQQSSRSDAALRQRDPYNLLLARQGRWRVPAEGVRDTALSLSGLLSPTLGGPSVKPYQPAGYWEHLNFPRREWQKDAGPSLYRRTLYTHWQRTFLHPALLAFDAQSREECVAERPISNTPQQALTLLNETGFVESARVLGERLLREGGASHEDRARWAIRLALQRPAGTEEVEMLASLARRQEAAYLADPASTAALLRVGDHTADASLPPAALAGAAAVARVILNLHETHARE